ncbi:MAG: D-alanyl-D-alaninecarboxypeptidase/D-alanyl-D-alanine-endopeptidase [Frankiales bacterium]|nr:D-alanyl-D-alaninecarboxypeptidase/D-alanyl-D-alanine-endopeptidase [Frankiales bacterium]
MLATTVLAAGVLGAVLLKDRAGDRTTTPPPAASPSPDPVRTPLLAPAAAGGSALLGARVAAALRAALAHPALKSGVALSVVDVETGRPVLEQRASRAVVPASTAKVLTALAALTVLPPDRQLTTKVVAGSGTDVVLVGGGDPTLRGPRTPGSGPRLQELADQVKQSGHPVGRVVVDDTLFTGPRLGPGWKGGYVTGGDVSPVSALELSDSKSTDPALEAGRVLAKLLGVPTSTVVRQKAAVSGATIARVSSAAVPDLVEQMLTTSDNDLAEALGRHLALARRQPASFAGEAAAAAAAVAPLLQGIGISAGAVSLHDASGLSPLDRVRPGALSRLLALAARDERFGPVLSGLPVAGFDGTLSDRYRDAPTSIAAGQVRAKTGTLTGVSALAGLVRTKDGRLLAFDLTAEGLPEKGAGAAPRALDAVAAALAGCGCGT